MVGESLAETDTDCMLCFIFCFIYLPPFVQFIHLLICLLYIRCQYHVEECKNCHVKAIANAELCLSFSNQFDIWMKEAELDKVEYLF